MKNYEWLQDMLKEMALAACFSLVSVVVLVKTSTMIVEMIQGLFR